MKTARSRMLMRWIHLMGGVAISTYVYAPWRDTVWFTILMQFIIIPVLTLTGVWMWKGHLLRPKKTVHFSSIHLINS